MKALRGIILGIALIVAPATFAASGEYAEISCASQAFFGTNSCNQCFDGGSIAVGQKLTGLFDSWTNKNKSEQMIYESEQVRPSLVNLGGADTSFLSSPTDAEKFWNFGSEIIFTPESGATASGSTGSTAVKNVYTLKAGKTVRVFDSEFGAYYALEKTGKKNGDYIGLAKFPVNYRDISESTGKPGLIQKHMECVAYKLAGSTPAPVKATPVAPTKVKTGAADTFLFLGLAMLLGLALMFARKRREV